MDSKSQHLAFRWLPRLALLAMLVVAGTLAACQPSSEPTLPPATSVAAATGVAETTAVAAATDELTTPEQAADTPMAELPAANTEVAPTTEPTAEPVQRQATTLTILHTNDVTGETDPCG
jgi:2',3'-cyclic-nucleotide 2'-phosphodiesterase (5'-nucleotidase family)